MYRIVKITALDPHNDVKRPAFTQTWRIIVGACDEDSQNSIYLRNTSTVWTFCVTTEENRSMKLDLLMFMAGIVHVP